MNFSWYGLLIGLAVVVALVLAEHLLFLTRPKAAKRTNWGQLAWAIFLGGVVGARGYHVWTDWSLYRARPITALFIWQGGLGIWGGIAGGLIGLTIWHKLSRSTWRWLELADAAAIVTPFGQAIGRLGNWCNQEIYGPPTNLPWKIWIAPEHRLPALTEQAYYHPLWLYEALANLVIGLLLYCLWRINRSCRIFPFFQLGSGGFLALWMLGYGTVRFSLELLRLESALGWGGLTIAQWVALGAIAGGLSWLAVLARQSVARLAGALAGLAFLIWSATSVRAQTPVPFDLSISPSVVEITVKPGKLVTQAFLLENSGSDDLEVTPVLRDFTADNQTGRVVLQEVGTFPYAQLANAEQQLNQPFLLPSGGSQQLVLGLDIPENAVERDWYFTLLLTTRRAATTSLTDSGAEARGAIGANLLVRITATDTTPLSWNIKLQLPRFIDSLQTLTPHALISNNSDTVASPELSLVILDWKNQIVHQQDGLPDRILAHSSREIWAAQARRDDPRSFDSAPFTYNPLLALGPYRVRVTIRNAAAGPMIVEETVWALPFSLSAGIIILAIIYFLGRKSGWHLTATAANQPGEQQHRQPQRRKHRQPD